MDEDYEWQPPSEAEMKIIQARRERSDKISKLMGDYMLKGYKMLGICCPECSTILLQDKQGVNYCVACKELDTDTDKDDPVLSQDAARCQILEGSVPDVTDTDLSFMTRHEPTTTTTHSVSMTTSPPTLLQSSQDVSPGVVPLRTRNVTDASFSVTETTLSDKILWATDELKTSNSVEYSIQLCQLIKSSSEALHSLKTIP
ncbi:Protein ZNRD2 [Mactra antiquata]